MTVRICGRLLLLVAALATAWSCSRDPDEGGRAEASPSRAGSCAGGDPSRAVTLEAGGRCLWLEHHGGQKYLNVCVRRAYGAEAELTSEWRPLVTSGAASPAPAVAPDLLTHHVSECDVVSRESISMIVRDLADGRVVLERL